MNMRDAQILNARKRPSYCNLVTQVHFNCEHGNSLLSSETKVVKTHAPRRRRYASRAEQYARYIDCGPAAWDDRDY